MNRPRRARSPPTFGFEPGMMGRVDHPRIPLEYDDLYPPEVPPFEQPMMGGPLPPAFMDPSQPVPAQPYPPNHFRDHRLPSSYRAPALREPQPYPPTAGPSAATYKILCITNLNPKIADAPLRDALRDDFSQYGDISVTICHDNGERLAYIYFRSYEEAREARHSKSKTIMFDRQIEVEPIYEPRSSPMGTPPPLQQGPSVPLAPHSVPPMYPPRRRSITPPDYYDVTDPAQIQPPPPMEYARRHMHPMPYQRAVSPPPGFPNLPMPPHHYTSHRQPSPGHAPYDRYYMPGPQSPYSSPPRDSYGRPYHSGIPFPQSQPPYPGPYDREPRERSIQDGHLVRNPRGDPYYPIDGRDFPQPPNYPSSRSPLMQPGASHHYLPAPHEIHGTAAGYPVRHASPPRYADHPRYTSREFRREKFGGDHGDSGDGKPSRVLFITNIDPSKTESELRNIFDPYGTIEEVEVRKISSEIASAIIKFSSMDCAYKAKTALHGKYLGKVKCRILYGKVSASRRLWIGGFGPNTTMARLEDEFGRYGEIVSLDYISGRPYAYIEYETANQAQFATQHLRGTFVAEAERRIRIEYVDPVKNDKTGKQQTTATRQSPENDSKSRPSNTHEPASPQSRGIKRRSITPTDVDAKRPAQQIFEGSPNSSNLCDEHKSKNTLKSALDEDSTVQHDPISLKTEIRCNSKHESAEGLQDRLAQTRNIREIVDCCSVSWFGKLVLRNFTFFSKMLLFRGHKSVIEKYITKLNGENGDQCPVLHITQRWRLHSQPKLEEVKRRMQSANLGMILILPKLDQQSPAHSISSPGGFKTPMSTPSNQGPGSASTPSKQNGEQDESTSTDMSGNSGSSSPSAQSRPLKNLISYLEQKDAAGVIALNAIGQDNQRTLDAKDSKTLYAFPPGEFAFNLLKERAPNLRLDAKEEFLLGVIVSGANETKQT